MTSWKNGVGFFQKYSYLAKNGAHAKFGHTFFGHNSAISGLIASPGSDHYLSIGDEKSKLQCLFLICIFWASFGVEMGVAITRAPNGLGTPNPIRRKIFKIIIKIDQK